jgi:hypothetical protein
VNSGSDAESDAIRTAVQAALDCATPGERFPLPGVISDAYGIGRTAGSLDRLYRELVDQARERHAGPPTARAHPAAGVR